ncbi:MAG: transcriptional repressor [Rhodobacteraceae bacterium]|nr:transcriptional repressor [Paracoccaceae bacterium]
MPQPSPTGFSAHDHGACIDRVLAAAEDHCRRYRLQLTPVRRRVLEILLGEHKAQGAYDVLERLRAEGLGSQPPVAYRALSFLTSIGFVHRIERLNAFVACAAPGGGHAPAFLICRSCHSVAEARLPPGSGFLDKAATDAGFLIETAVIEAVGLCPACRGGGSRTA